MGTYHPLRCKTWLRQADG